MTAVQTIESLLPQTNKTEMVRLYSKIWGFSDGTFLGIEKTQRVCGGSACIIRTRIPVWSLVSFKKLGVSDIELLENYPSLRQQDLINAWNYYLVNLEEIEQEIKENDEA